MSTPEPTHGRPIQLNREYVAQHGQQKALMKLQRILGSVRFTTDKRMNTFRILGADTQYHDNDPYLCSALPGFTGETGLDGVRTFRERRKHFGLCFEDTWSGYFVAENCQLNGVPDALILIHLDDHTDMMSTLLDRSGDRLVDPTTNAQFDPTSKDSWWRTQRAFRMP